MILQGVAEDRMEVDRDVGVEIDDRKLNFSNREQMRPVCSYFCRASVS